MTTPAEVEISEASANDAAELSAFATKTYVDAWGPDFEPDDLVWHLERTLSVSRWVEHLSHDRVLWARIAGKPVGFVQFGPGRAPGEILIDRLYIEAHLQGQGIGSRLLARVLTEPEILAAEAVTIEVWQDNFGARRLYERFGFTHEGGRVPFVLKSGEIDGYDLVLVRRPGADLTAAQPPAGRLEP